MRVLQPGSGADQSTDVVGMALYGSAATALAAVTLPSFQRQVLAW